MPNVNDTYTRRTDPTRMQFPLRWNAQQNPQGQTSRRSRSSGAGSTAGLKRENRSSAGAGMCRHAHRPTEEIVILGLRTALYPSPDLATAKKWYSELLGVPPYCQTSDYPAAILPPAAGNPAGCRILTPVYWGSPACIA